MSGRAVITEMEWWDRIAVAVELLEKRPGVKLLPAGKVRWVSDTPPPPGPAEGPEVTAYVFPSLDSVEILRRITQMPDETPLDMLAVPFSVYCPDMNAFVSVNAPSVGLEEHLKILEESRL